MLLIGSDHGQETIGHAIDVQDWLASEGLGRFVASRDVAVAGQGTAAVLYATERGLTALHGVLDRLRLQPWVDEVLTGQQLARLGYAAQGGIVAAFNTARIATPNAHGVPGQRWAVAEPDKPTGIGNGQHGGWGPDETRPFLMIEGPGVAAGSVTAPTSLVDIAPTILAFLGLPRDAMDGTPIEFHPAAAARSAGG
jgi:arylsulfatase A-like enzyme